MLSTLELGSAGVSNWRMSLSAEPGGHLRRDTSALRTGILVPSLFVIQGNDQGKRFELVSPVASIGRDISNTIRLADSEVSRKHAQFQLDDLGEAYWLVDTGSSNGIYVNTQPIDRIQLQTGDRIQIGGTLMIFTGSNVAKSIPPVEGINIAAEAPVRSHITHSLSNQEASRLDEAQQGDLSPWLARARSNLQIMYRTALAVSHTLDIDQLLVRIMEMIFEWVAADRGCVLLVDQASGELRPRVRKNRPGKGTSEQLSISQTILDYVMQQSEGVLTSDAQDDQRFDSAGSIVTMGVREAICVPLQGRYGIVGVIYIDTFTPPGRLIQGVANQFNEEHLKLMIAIGHQAALAIEDTSYYSAMVQSERLAAIGQTIAGLSHHVKNILQGIRGGSYLIEEGLKVEETDLIQKGWGIVERNQEKISRLVLDMLTFSKQREPELIESDLNQIVSEVVELMRHRAAELNVTLEWSPHDQLPPFTLDPAGIHHAVLNILTNAIDACCDVERNGIVTVSLDFQANSGVASIAVTDNGMGIRDDQIEAIFHVFESSKGNRGTGLGLAVSRKIINEHGGRILVSSRVGYGSTFTLELQSLHAATSSQPGDSPDIRIDSASHSLTRHHGSPGKNRPSQKRTSERHTN